MTSRCGYQTTTGTDGRSTLTWDGFSTTVALHKLRASIGGIALPLDIDKQTTHGPLKHLNLSPASVTLTALDEEFEFVAAPTDEFSNAVTPTTIVWTPEFADTANVVHPGAGKVKARGNGRTRVLATVTANGVSVTESVVVDVAQRSASGMLTIMGPSIVDAGLSAVFTGAGIDANAKAIKNFRWSITAGATFAEIVGPTRQETDQVRGLAPGTVTLRATDPNGATVQTLTITIVSGS